MGSIYKRRFEKENEKIFIVLQVKPLSMLLFQFLIILILLFVAYIVPKYFDVKYHALLLFVSFLPIIIFCAIGIYESRELFKAQASGRVITVKKNGYLVSKTQWRSGLRNDYKKVYKRALIVLSDEHFL